jgi:DNA-binding response OmpR family regulator
MIRVLVVDPENRTAGTVAAALEGQKMRPTAVCSVEEALQQLCSNPRHAVIFAASPSAAGDEELCRAICERTLAPVLVVGREDGKAAMERLLSAGADAHILEPLTAEVLVAQLWALLRRVGLVKSRSRMYTLRSFSSRLQRAIDFTIARPPVQPSPGAHSAAPRA